jgi:hypothetical protein
LAYCADGEELLLSGLRPNIGIAEPSLGVSWSQDIT